MPKPKMNPIEEALRKQGNPKPILHPSLPPLWEIWRGEWCLDGEGKREKWATKNFYVLDGRTDPVGEGYTIVEALRDAGLEPGYTKSLRHALGEIHDQAMSAAALMELSGAVDYEHPKGLHKVLLEMIRDTEHAMQNTCGELDPPEYEEKPKTK